MGLAVIALLASHPVRIIAVDIVEAKLKMAGELGASCLVNSTYGDAESAMRIIPGGGAPTPSSRRRGLNQVWTWPPVVSKKTGAGLSAFPIPARISAG